ncbi:MAG: site-2 protease family protein [Acidobacteriota bacterium]|nr:site-2 protease family protein [Acidobacteriota bacterium]
MSMTVVLALFEFVVLVLAISVHNAVQAWYANRKGDPTARMLGYVSLNPVKHADVFGTLLWPAISIVLFHSNLLLGWGKPVPITTRNFRHPGRDEMQVYLSGLVAHLLAAAACLLLLVVLKHTIPAAANQLGVASFLALGVTDIPTEGLSALFPIMLFLYLGIVTNLLLFVFNLLPLPSVDGGKVLRYYLPYNAQQTFDNLGIYLMFGFFFLGYRIIMLFFVPLLVLFNGLLHLL